MKYGLAGLGGLIIGAAGTSGSTKTKTTTQVADRTAQTVTVTRTVDHTRTVRAKPKPQPSPTPTPAPSAPTASAAVKSFSGNGGRTLAPFTIDSPATLKWTNDGDIFQVFDIDNGVTINADSHSGETYLEPGTYKLDVNALGNWTIRIVPE
jgi:hypothetical protein